MQNKALSKIIGKEPIFCCYRCIRHVKKLNAPIWYDNGNNETGAISR